MLDVNGVDESEELLEEEGNGGGKQPGGGVSDGQKQLGMGNNGHVGGKLKGPQI